MKKYVIHQVGVAQGFGDLVYFAKWIKLYSKNFKMDTDKIHIIGDEGTENTVAEFIENLQAKDPEHPLLQFITMNGKDVMYNTQNVNVMFQNDAPENFSHPSDIFSDLTEDDDILIYSISFHPWPLRNDKADFDFIPTIISELATREAEVVYADEDNEAAMEVEDSEEQEEEEEDSEEEEESEEVKSYHKEQDASEQLGLAIENWGLLIDDELDPNENINALLTRCPDQVLNLISEGNLSINLKNKCYVYGYVQQSADKRTLLSILNSPWLNEHMSQGIKPIFILSGIKDLSQLPKEILELSQNGVIRLQLIDYLPPRDFEVLNKIMLNNECNSIVVPSGDNSLTDALYAGHLPFYAFPSDTNAFLKTVIYEQLIALMQNELANDHNMPGYADCMKLFEVLVDRKRYEPAADDWYIQRGKYLTPEAAKYFKKVAKYIQENLTFEKRSLDKIKEEVLNFNPDLVLKSKTALKFT